MNFGFRSKTEVSAPIDVKHEVHVDQYLNWSFDKSVDPTTIFSKEKILGKGGFGTVCLMIHEPSKKELAGKIINPKLVDAQTTEILQKEVDLLRQIKTNYAVRYFGSVPYENSLMILMELCDKGSLRDLLDHREEVFSEAQISVVMHDLLLALDYLHTKHLVIHRDIKAANILLTSNSEIKVADFGVSRRFDKGNECQTATIIGTPYWMAPEVINGTGYSFPADIWSVGITAIELAEGAPPYIELPPTRAMLEIANYGFPGFRYPEMHSNDFLDFVNNCVKKKPEDRFTIQQLLNHPFITRSKIIPRQFIMKELIECQITESSSLAETTQIPSNEEIENLPSSFGINRIINTRYPSENNRIPLNDLLNSVNNVFLPNADLIEFPNNDIYQIENDDFFFKTRLPINKINNEEENIKINNQLEKANKYIKLTKAVSLKIPFIPCIKGNTHNNQNPKTIYLKSKTLNKNIKKNQINNNNNLLQDQKLILGLIIISLIILMKLGFKGLFLILLIFGLIFYLNNNNKSKTD